MNIEKSQVSQAVADRDVLGGRSTGEGRCEQGEDRGSTTAVRCKAPHRAKLQRSLRDKFVQNRGVLWNLVAARA